MKREDLKRWFLLGLVLAQPFLAIRGAEAAPVSAAEVLRSAMEARGGREAFLGIRSFRAKGSVSFFTVAGPWWSAPAITNVWALEILAMRPDQFRFVPDLSSTTAPASLGFVPPRYFENGVEGRTAWEALPGNPPLVLEGILGEERRELARCFAWCAEAQDYRSVTNVGETDYEGQRCDTLKLVRPSGNPEIHYYSVATHLLAGIVRSSAFGPSLERFTFERYRAFGGFQFPTRVLYRAEDERYHGTLKAIEELDSLEVNCVNESQFTRPSVPVQLNQPAGTTSGGIASDELPHRLQGWVETDKLADSIVVGLLGERGRQVTSAGRLKNAFYLLKTEKHQFGTIVTHRRADADTLYPLCSISKVFTRLLLLDMVQRGEMRLDDPVQWYLPASVHMPTRSGKPITLLHLATHTSGLPRYFGSSEKQAYAFLAHHELRREPGAEYEYSNTGMGLLGKAIERKAGSPFPKLVMERICRPLGMRHTRVMNYDFPGVDGVRASANDLLTFASACLGLTPTPPVLGSLMQHEYATHGGAGGGFVLDFILDHPHRRAVVILASGPKPRYGDAQAALHHLILSPLPPLSATNTAAAPAGMARREEGQPQ